MSIRWLVVMCLSIFLFVGCGPDDEPGEIEDGPKTQDGKNDPPAEKKPDPEAANKAKLEELRGRSERLQQRIAELEARSSRSEDEAKELLEAKEEREKVLDEIDRVLDGGEH